MASKTPRLRATGSTFVAGFVLAATAFLLWHTFSPIYETTFATAGRGPVFFPRILLVLMLLLSAGVLGQSLIHKDGNRAGGSFGGPHLLSVGLAAVATGAYLYLIYLVGYLLASIAFSFTLPVIFGYRRWGVIAAFAAVYATATWYVFEVIFRIVLPKSPWFISF